MRGSWITAALLATASVLVIAADLSQSDAKKLVNPIPFTRGTVSQGNALFQQNCTGCHGKDGKADMAIVPATDLTAPRLYKNGTSDGEMFRSIHDGAGDQMPPFKYQGLTETEIWQLVNFIHSLWPESMRPPLQQDDPKKRGKLM